MGAIDLTGKVFSKLTVLKRVENSSHNAAQWLCVCECGNKVIVNSNNLRTGHSKSCGCVRKHKTSEWMMLKNTKHGKAGTRLYRVWGGIKSRTTNPNNPRYKDYGGRGITMCDTWHNFDEFQKWALEHGYNESAEYGDCTIDRINVDGNYEPDNCRWVSLKEQANNKRGSKNAEKVFTAT